MNRIELDTGIEEFCFTGGGVLRFIPRDPNLYARFLEAEQELDQLEQALQRQAKELDDTPNSAVALTHQADKQIKELLNRVFGGDNDFHTALGGVSLLAIGSNGKHVLANLMTVLEDILSRGAEEFARDKAGEMLGK